MCTLIFCSKKSLHKSQNFFYFVSRACFGAPLLTLITKDIIALFVHLEDIFIYNFMIIIKVIR